MADASMRARSHHDDLAREEPAILGPHGGEDPEIHIEYVEDQPCALSPLGERTISVCGLRRLQDVKRNAVMVELRRKHERVVRWRDEDSPCAREMVEEAREYLRRSVLPEAPFSAMAKAFRKAHPPP